VAAGCRPAKTGASSSQYLLEDKVGLVASIKRHMKEKGLPGNQEFGVEDKE